MATLEQILNKKKKQLLRDMQVASIPVAQVVEKKFKEKIEDYVYSRPPSEHYERSRGLINATTYFVTKQASSMHIQVFIEPTLMNYSPYEEHSSWVTGSDERESLPFWINYGHSGIVSYSPALFLENTIEELNRNKEHTKELIKQLTMLGYTIK